MGHHDEYEDKEHKSFKPNEHILVRVFNRVFGHFLLLNLNNFQDPHKPCQFYKFVKSAHSCDPYHLVESLLQEQIKG